MGIVIPTPLVHYDFHEGSGSTTTSIISALSLTALNPATSWSGQAAAGNGGAFHVSGYDESFGVANGATINEWSMAFDVIVNSLDGSGAWSAFYVHGQAIAPATMYMTFQQSQGKVQFWRSNAILQSNDPIILGQMQRYVIVCTTTETKLYIDGELKAQDTVPTPYNESDWLYTRIPDPSEPFDGKVTNVRFWDQALDDTQVAAIGATLLGEWGFLDNLDDTSGGGHTGTFNDNGAGGSLTYVSGPHANSRGVKFGHEDHAIEYGRTGLESTKDGVTIMGWIKFEGNPPGGSYLQLSVLNKARAPSSSRIRLGTSYDGIDMRKGNAASRWKDDLQFGEWDSNTYLDDNWHHFAQVDGNTRWAWYLDGVEVGLGTRSFDNSTPPIWENYPWITGHNTVVSDQRAHPNMSVSGVRIFEGELTQAGIEVWMNTPIVARGKVKVWNGSSWSAHPMKVWNGSAWEIHPAKGWDGSGWVEGKSD